MNNRPRVLVHKDGDIEVVGFGVFKDSNVVEIEVLKLLIATLAVGAAGGDSSEITERLVQYITEHPSAQALFHPKEGEGK